MTAEGATGSPGIRDREEERQVFGESLPSGLSLEAGR